MNAFHLQKSIILALLLAGCTPLARAQGLTSVGAVACATGRGASAGGEDWGAVVSAAGCWLADWAAARADKHRDRELAAAAERLRLALVAAERDLDAQAVEDVEQAHAACVALSGP